MDRLSSPLLAAAAVALAGFVVLTAPGAQGEQTLPAPLVEPVGESASTVVIETVAPPSTVVPELAAVPESVAGVLSGAGLAGVADRSTELADVPGSIVDVLMDNDVVLIVPQVDETTR